MAEGEGVPQPQLVRLQKCCKLLQSHFLFFTLSRIDQRKGQKGEASGKEDMSPFVDRPLFPMAPVVLALQSAMPPGAAGAGRGLMEERKAKGAGNAVSPHSLLHRVTRKDMDVP